MEMIRKYLKEKYQLGGYQIAQIEYLLKTTHMQCLERWGDGCGRYLDVTGPTK